MPQADEYISGHTPHGNSVQSPVLLLHYYLVISYRRLLVLCEIFALEKMKNNSNI